MSENKRDDSVAKSGGGSGAGQSIDTTSDTASTEDETAAEGTPIQVIPIGRPGTPDQFKKLKEKARQASDEGEAATPDRG